VEWCALRLAGHPQPPWVTAQRSFVANSLSALLGFGLASGTAVRVRAYAAAKLPATEVAELVVLCTAATDLSGVVTLGLSALAALRPISAALSMSIWATALGAGVLVASAALWFVLFRHGRHGGPHDADRAAALCAGVGDWVFSGAALFVLTSVPLSGFPAFLAVFCLGSLLGALAGVPGGVGVLEATVLGAHVGSLAHTTVAALILYRVIYFLGPAGLALVGVAASRLTAARAAVSSKSGA
jgi:phosphatidylglycerol lysyltransferase